MALDGIVLSSIVHELQDTLVGGRIDKIHQIEKEEILLTIRNQGTAHKLLLTANSHYPRLHLSSLAQNSQLSPPMFCMLLRKHLAGGRLLDISQPDLERIVTLSIEATNELGDKEVKLLTIEIMGRHSNIILMKQDHTIIDSIKHIASDKSSVREVLPGRTYTRPPSQDKVSPLDLSFETFTTKLLSKELPVFKALYTSFNGLSPTFSMFLCHEAQTDQEQIASSLHTEALRKLYDGLMHWMKRILLQDFNPTLYLEAGGRPYDFYCFDLPSFQSDYAVQSYDSISTLLEAFYFERNTHFNVAQKTGDIKKLLHNYLERAIRKQHIQEKALEDADRKEEYRIYGELLTVYAHQIPANAASYETMNYYSPTCETVTIPLDAMRSGIENAQGYYKLYNKAKRTEQAALQQLESIKEDIDYLQSVILSLDLLETKEDIDELRQELVEMGYLKKRKSTSKVKSSKRALPFLHFKSSLGHDIYVGKNNYQNDHLTMKFAKPNDLWLHIKDGPGSHVIIKAQDQQLIPEDVLLEGALLAAYYSSGKMSSRVPIDYTYKRHVKKVPNAKPGMVIYTQFKTLYVTPTESAIQKLSITS